MRRRRSLSNAKTSASWVSWPTGRTRMLHIEQLVSPSRTCLMRFGRSCSICRPRLRNSATARLPKDGGTRSVNLLSAQRMLPHHSIQGLIYRDYRPVHYSPSSRSALAEAELSYQDDHISHSVYVTFAIDMKPESMGRALRKLLEHEQDAHLVVWTTTPWTLTANMVRL